MKKTLLLLALLTQSCVLSFAQEKNFIDQPYIEVTGNFDTLITPNQIYIRIVVSEKDTKDKISLEKSETQMIVALKALGINTDKNLTIHDMASNYKKYVFKERDILKSKEYLLMVGDASMATRVFIALEKIGISNTNIDRVEHSDIENLKNFCKARAVLVAKHNALTLVKPLQQTIGNAIYISENGSYSHPSASPRLMMSKVQMADAVEDKYIPPPIEFEKIKLTSNVFIKFILK